MTNNSDSYRDIFKQFLKQGATALEALNNFDSDQWNAAVVAEIESGELRVNPTTFRIEVNGKMSLLEYASKAAREKMNLDDMDKAIKLWCAGWKSETPHKSQTDIFQWFWRRPPIGSRKIGKLFMSTEQAYRALNKSNK